MAWLARSIANSLKLDEDEDDEKQQTKPASGEDAGEDQPPSPSQTQSPRGVKEDLSELTKTLRSQFWGVASFLAPPPPASSDHPEKSQTPNHVDENRASSDHEEGEEDLIAGIRSDFAEIGGRFKTGISKISGNIAVSEFTKMASSFLQLGSDEANTKEYSVGDVVGVTEEVVAFARDIAMHPETWLDFPLPDEDDNFDDFEMSDAQQEHALAMERLAPALASLRFELCPAHVLESRALLSYELQKRSKAAVPTASEPDSPKNVTAEATRSVESPEFETEKHPVESKDIQVVDKSVIEETPVVTHDKPSNPKTASSGIIDVEVEEDDADDWLKDEDTSGSMRTTTMPLGNDEDVSFSDLEDDEEEGDVPVNFNKKVASGSDSSAKDWLDVEDIDVM